MESKIQSTHSLPTNPAELPPIPPQKPKKIFGRIFTILVLIVLVAAGAFTYFYAQTYFELNTQLDQMTKRSTPRISPAVLPTSSTTAEGTLCGGPVLESCPTGYTCHSSTVKSGTNNTETSGRCEKAELPQVTLAKQQLAKKLGIADSLITVRTVEDTEWHDTSLGCPQGVVPAQVITPGYRIVLQANQTTYEYHSNNATNVITCTTHIPQ
ncbi:hypothetical protein BH11PAT1_BH11PAT1_3880 [soil metagenome]